MQGALQLGQLGIGILNNQLPILLGISNGGLPGNPLSLQALEPSLKLAGALVHLRDLCLCAAGVIPLFPGQHLQLFILGLVHALTLSPAADGDVLILDLDLSDAGRG